MKSGMTSSKFKILNGTLADEGSSLIIQNESNSDRASPLNAELPIEDFDKYISRYYYGGLKDLMQRER